MIEIDKLKSEIEAIDKFITDNEKSEDETIIVSLISSKNKRDRLSRGLSEATQQAERDRDALERRVYLEGRLKELQPELNALEDMLASVKKYDLEFRPIDDFLSKLEFRTREVQGNFDILNLQLGALNNEPK